MTDAHLNGDDRKYQSYLRSSEWAVLCDAVWQRCHGICERCHHLPMQHVHHLTYNRVYNEDLRDLQGLCEGCHEFVHDLRAIDPRRQWQLQSARGREPGVRKGNVGCSLFTSEKLDRYDYFVRTQVEIVKRISRKVPIVYHLFDFYAGPGCYVETDCIRVNLAGEIGSPIRAIQILKAEGLPYRAFLFEPDEPTRHRLEANLLLHGITDVSVGSEECDEAISLVIQSCALRRKIFGLSFFDPNGMPEWNTVKRLAKSFPMLDIMINVNATSIKRLRGSAKYAETKSATEHLCEVKDYVSLWEPCLGDRHHFSLAVCSNFEFNDIAKHGFYNIKSPDGELIARRIDLSEKQQKATRQTTGLLPGLEDIR